MDDLDFRPIPRYGGDYSISSDGEVWSYKRNVTLRPEIKNNYLTVNLQLNGKTRCEKIHRLVLESFVGPCPLGNECRHLNGNPMDNRLDNLKWGTRSENQLDAVQHGTSSLLLNRKKRWIK